MLHGTLKPADLAAGMCWSHSAKTQVKSQVSASLGSSAQPAVGASPFSAEALTHILTLALWAALATPVVGACA